MWVCWWILSRKRYIKIQKLDRQRWLVRRTLFIIKVRKHQVYSVCYVLISALWIDYNVLLHSVVCPNFVRAEAELTNENAFIYKTCKHPYYTYVTWVYCTRLSYYLWISNDFVAAFHQIYERTFISMVCQQKGLSLTGSLCGTNI